MSGDQQRRGRRGLRTKEMVAIAGERMETLLEASSRATLAGRRELAARYVGLARKIGMRYNVRVPEGYKKYYCKSCNTPFTSAASVRVRFTGGRVTCTCLKCGRVRRFGLGESHADLSLPVNSRPVPE